MVVLRFTIWFGYFLNMTIDCSSWLFLFAISHGCLWYLNNQLIDRCFFPFNYGDSIEELISFIETRKLNLNLVIHSSLVYKRMLVNTNCLLKLIILSLLLLNVLFIYWLLRELTKCYLSKRYKTLNVFTVKIRLMHQMEK